MPFNEWRIAFHNPFLSFGNNRPNEATCDIQTLRFNPSTFQIIQQSIEDKYRDLISKYRFYPKKLILDPNTYQTLCMGLSPDQRLELINEYHGCEIIVIPLNYSFIEFAFDRNSDAITVLFYESRG